MKHLKDLTAAGLAIGAAYLYILLAAGIGTLLK